MQYLYNREHTERLEQQALEQGVVASPLDLCEQKATAFSQQYFRDFRGELRSVVIFAGPGENGAVSLAIGRILAGMGNRVEAVVLNLDMSEECFANTRALQEVGVEVHEVSTSFAPPIITEETIVIDGLCGIENDRPLTGGFAAIAKYINQKSKTTLSVDIPSGLMAEDNSQNDLSLVVRAHYTYTFYGPKLAFLLAENAECVGNWHAVAVGSLLLLEQDFNERKQSIFTADDFQALQPPRKKFSHKYDYGRVALVAGSQGMMGASLLAGRACMRAGSGHLTLHVPQGKDWLVHATLPEALVSIDVSSSCFTSFPSPEKYDAIAVGPGIGRAFETATALETLLRSCSSPVVLDADAIHLLADHPSLLEVLPEGSIITPHVGEFDALMGPSSNDYERLLKALSLADKYKIIVVLKGAYTAVCNKGGRVIFNTYGNPGMATAGAGDVLAGVTLAFLGKWGKPLHASICAACICGYAGMLYSMDYSEESLLASDLVDYLPKAFKIFKSN